MLFAFASLAIVTEGQNVVTNHQDEINNGENSYYIGFDDKKQLKEWKEYRINTKEGDGWYVDKVLAHDYCPSAGMKNKQTDDWFVSPAFEIQQGGQIDSIKYKSIGMMSEIIDGDTIGIYLLRGNQDPKKAKERILLLDIRGDNYPYMLSEYTIKKNIELPKYDEPCYIAFRYKNDKFDTRWYTLHFDDLSISGVKTVTGIHNVELNEENISVFPNPCHDVINLNGLKKASSIRIYSATGNLIYSADNVKEEYSINVSKFANGIYILEVVNGNNKFKKKIMKK